MSIPPLKSVWIGKYTEPSEVLRELNSEVESMISMCKSVDFSDAQEREQFKCNILYIKQYFERYNVLIMENASGKNQS